MIKVDGGTVLIQGKGIEELLWDYAKLVNAVKDTLDRKAPEVDNAKVLRKIAKKVLEHGMESVCVDFGGLDGEL